MLTVLTFFGTLAVHMHTRQYFSSLTIVSSFLNFLKPTSLTEKFSLVTLLNGKLNFDYLLTLKVFDTILIYLCSWQFYSSLKSSSLDLGAENLSDCAQNTVDINWTSRNVYLSICYFSRNKISRSIPKL